MGGANFVTKNLATCKKKKNAKPYVYAHTVHTYCTYLARSHTQSRVECKMYRLSSKLPSTGRLACRVHVRRLLLLYFILVFVKLPTVRMIRSSASQSHRRDRPETARVLTITTFRQSTTLHFGGTRTCFNQAYTNHDTVRRGGGVHIKARIPALRCHNPSPTRAKKKTLNRCHKWLQPKQ